VKGSPEKLRTRTRLPRAASSRSLADALISAWNFSLDVLDWSVCVRLDPPRSAPVVTQLVTQSAGPRMD